MPDYPFLNLLESVEVKLEQAIVLYVVKEWNLSQRFMEDYQIENARYEEVSQEVKSLLQMRTTPPRRGNNFLGTTDY